MDESTKTRYLDTIKEFFPRGLCGSFPGYPDFYAEQQDTMRIITDGFEIPDHYKDSFSGYNYYGKEARLDAGFAESVLRVAVEEGDHIVRVWKIPGYRYEFCDGNPYMILQVQQTCLGFFLMVSRHGRFFVKGCGYIRQQEKEKTLRGPGLWFFTDTRTRIDEFTTEIIDFLVRTRVEFWIREAPKGSDYKYAYQDLEMEVEGHTVFCVPCHSACGLERKQKLFLFEQYYRSPIPLLRQCLDSLSLQRPRDGAGDAIEKATEVLEQARNVCRILDPPGPLGPDTEPLSWFFWKKK